MAYRRPKVNTLVALALVALAVIITASFLSIYKVAAPQREEPVVASPAVSATPTPTLTPTTTVPPTTTAQPTPTSSSSPRPTTSKTPTPTTTKTQVAPPRGAKLCGESTKFQAYAGNSTTSCPFVMNIAKQMDAQANNDGTVKIKANSPTTKKDYQVTCTPGASGQFSCTGGNRGHAHLIPK